MITIHVYSYILLYVHSIAIQLKKGPLYRACIYSYVNWLVYQGFVMFVYINLFIYLCYFVMLHVPLWYTAYDR